MRRKRKSEAVRDAVHPLTSEPKSREELETRFGRRLVAAAIRTGRIISLDGGKHWRANGIQIG